MAHVIYTPRPEEALALAQVHLQAWLQTYPNQEAGIDEAWIEDNLGSVVTPEGIAQWEAVIEEAERCPTRSSAGLSVQRAGSSDSCAAGALTW
jgi:hypothetical protein